MGGHGGLNILPQKSWNVYNFDNREKVRKDEEAAAREEQTKREDSRRRDFELRLQSLRQARSRHPPTPNPNPNPTPSDPNHINLFENTPDLSSAGSGRGTKGGAQAGEDGGGGGDGKTRKRKEPPAKVVITPEDEKYRLGYGLMGKGVKAPWYLSKRAEFDVGDEDRERGSARGDGKDKKMMMIGSEGKKSIQELREERMRREVKEKERERALLLASKKTAGFSRRRM